MARSPGLPLAANTLLTRREPVARGWLVAPRPRAAAGRRASSRGSASARGGAEAVAGSLSGGNLQKFIVGREIDAAPKVLVVGAADLGPRRRRRRADPSARCRALRDAGCAVLVVSEDLDELFELCTDLVVIARGRLSPRIAVRDATIAQIGQWMSGLSARRRAPALLPLRRRGPCLGSSPRSPPSRALTLRRAARRRWRSPSLFGAVLFAALGTVRRRARFAMFFIEPLRDADALSELAIKATPLALIALGLAIVFRANVWNIGAEGQFIVGAIAATGVALRRTAERPAAGCCSPMIVAGVAGGMAVGGDRRLAARSLQRQRDPGQPDAGLRRRAAARLPGLRPLEGSRRLQFPADGHVLAQATQIPLLVEGHRGATSVCSSRCWRRCGAWLFLCRTYAGFQLEVGGSRRAPRATPGSRRGARSGRRCLVRAALAGLAGALEVAGPLGQLTPHLPVGYGFAAIIVAFVGRLHPFGIVLSSVLMSMLYIGGELAQSRLGLPQALTGVFQGLLLFALLACDALASSDLRRAQHARRREGRSLMGGAGAHAGSPS